MHAATSPFLTLTIEDHSSTAIVHLHGRLISGHTDLLYTPVAPLLATHKHVVLDLCHLTQMDSMGLGVLIRLYAAAKTKGCTVELRNLAGKVRELLIMTNLLSVFGAVGEQNIRM
jgi:anti-sigma B factor antagonist